MIDKFTVDNALGLASALGFNPLDIARGAVDWVGAELFGIGQCSDSNKRLKKNQARALADQTLVDLVNGVRPWNEFSSGDCGKWFKAYAVEELLKRFDGQQMPAPSNQPAKQPASGAWRRIAGTMVSGVTAAQEANLNPYAVVADSGPRVGAINLTPALQAAIDLHNIRKAGFVPAKVVTAGVNYQRAQAAKKSGMSTGGKVAATVGGVTLLALLFKAMRGGR